MKENMKLLFYKPWKLILSIFLSALIVASVAISSVIYTTNSKEKSIDWLYKNVNGYVNVNVIQYLNYEIREEFKKQTNLEVLDIYSTGGSNQNITIPYYEYVYNKDLYYKSNYDRYLFTNSFTSFYDNKNIEKDLDFAYGNKLPDEGEIVINDLLLEYFKNFGYKNRNDETDYISANDLQKDPSKIIGKTLRIYAKNEYSNPNDELNGKDLTICSVINTGLITKTKENNFIYNFGLYNLNIVSKDYLQTLLNSAYFNVSEIPDNMYIKIRNKDDFKVFMNYLYKIEKTYVNENKYFLGNKLYVNFLNTKKYEQRYLDINNVEYNKDSLPEDKEIVSISMKIHDDQIVYTDLYGGYNYDNLKNVSIVLISIATILLIIFLANIVPYIRDEITNNPDYFKQLKHTKKLTKFFLVQYLVLVCSTFILSLILSFFLSLITNSLMIGSAYGEIYQLSIFYPITVNYICMLVSLLLSLLLTLFGFVFVKKYLKEIDE